MSSTQFCQSCTMPIENVNDRGTEKDGSISNDYCKFCYQNGLFTEPEMTLEQMKTEVEYQMKKRDMPDTLLQKALTLLPLLKRWHQ